MWTKGLPILLVICGITIISCLTAKVFKYSDRSSNIFRGQNIQYPHGISHLKEMIHKAREEGCKICVVGAGMSQNGQNIGDERFMMIKLDKMNNVKIDPGREVAVVTGNVTFRDVEEKANEYGLTTKTRQASGIFGVLSSISTNVHGWDHKAGCIGNTVNWIKILDSVGREKTVGREDEAFKECVGGFGGTYLMYETEIQLTKNILLRKEKKTFESIIDAVEEFKKNFDKADMSLIRVGREQFSTMLFYPEGERGWRSENLQFEPKRGPYIERLIVDISRFMIQVRLKKVLDSLYESCVERGWTGTEIGLRNEFMNVNVNAINKVFTGMIRTHKFWLVEYFIPEEHLGELIDLYKEQYRGMFVFNASIRYVPEYKDSYTAYAKTDVFALVICWDQILTEKKIRESEERNRVFLEFLEKKGGKFYLPYKNNPENVKRFYGEFAEKVKESDSVFSNLMIEKLREL